MDYKCLAPSLGCILCNATQAVEAQGLLRNQETYYNIYVLQLLIEDIYFCDIIVLHFTQNHNNIRIIIR